MSSKILTVMVTLAALAGCDKPANTTGAPAATAPVAAPPPNITAQDWTAAVAGAYVASKKESKDDGITEFLACFDDVSSGSAKCNMFMFGKRDAFRKVTHFTPAWTQLAGSGGAPYVGSYLAVPDCKEPVVFIASHFWGRSWLFMSKVAVMVDGELVLERDFKDQHSSVRREIYPGGVEEDFHFVANPQDRAGLAKLVPAKELAVRISGDKGYVTVGRNDLGHMRQDADAVQHAFDKLMKAVDGKIPANCP